jgi:hypothetical protein
MLFRESPEEVLTRQQQQQSDKHTHTRNKRSGRTQHTQQKKAVDALKASNCATVAPVARTVAPVACSKHTAEEQESDDEEHDLCMIGPNDSSVSLPEHRWDGPAVLLDQDGKDLVLGNIALDPFVIWIDEKGPSDSFLSEFLHF